MAVLHGIQATALDCLLPLLCFDWLKAGGQLVWSGQAALHVAPCSNWMTRSVSGHSRNQHAGVIETQLYATPLAAHTPTTN